MPTYAYQCDHCGHDFEAVQKFSDAPLTVCPKCEGRIRRVIHPAPVVFKGSGWYITDSRPKASENGAEKSDGKADRELAKEGTAKEPATAEKTDKAAKTAKTPAAASTE